MSCNAEIFETCAHLRALIDYDELVYIEHARLYVCIHFKDLSFLKSLKL